MVILSSQAYLIQILIKVVSESKYCRLEIAWDLRCFPDLHSLEIIIFPKGCFEKLIKTLIGNCLDFVRRRKKELNYSCSENKDADQLCSYCTADLCLCFRLGMLLVCLPSKFVSDKQCLKVGIGFCPPNIGFLSVLQGY